VDGYTYSFGSEVTRKMAGVLDAVEKLNEAVKKLNKPAIAFIARISKSGNRYVINIPAKDRMIGERLHGKYVYVILIPLE